MDPCGTSEEAKQSEFLPEYENVNQFMQHTLRSVLQATKASNELPASGDDFDYYSSFQGFQDAMDIEGKRILHVIHSILKHQNVKVNLGSTSGAADIEDKLDLLMDANDQILERVGSWLDEASGIKKNDSSLVVAEATPKHQSAASWNKKSPGSGSGGASSFRLLSARNIQRPQLRFRDKVDNRNRPFVPSLTHKWHARQTLEESMQIPQDVDTEDVNFLYPNPYKYEIDNLQYLPSQLSAGEAAEPQAVDDTPLIYVDSVDSLQDLVQELKKHSEIAVDLEHHSYRTYQGITCLMQVSTRSHDYLIDTLELRSDLYILNEIFTDPKIVKVFHGADSDIDWLQRDFGLYVVNMFDTGQAARVMGYSRFSLAHLLLHYFRVEADKKYQLADWRIRPLPEELQRYAREDTHYLLGIYDRMRQELLERGNESKNLLISVLTRSNQICAKVYRKPKFTEEDYLELYKKHKKVFNSRQLQALKELFAWRDETARMEDESIGYVLPNHMLLQICDILPRERQGVLACCNPIPPLVRQYLSEIFFIINTAREVPLEKVVIHKPEKASPTKQPTQAMDSLLHCPHDLSHGEVGNKSNPTLLDSSGLPRKDTSVDRLAIKLAQPLLTVFSAPTRPRNINTELQKRVAAIKSSFSSPYQQYLPDEDSKSILRPSKLGTQKSAAQNQKPGWKLLPNSLKRKERQASGEQQNGPPAKRSRTDLHEEKPGLTEDDRIALPPDIDAPLRFQVQSEKKKKKKNRNRDVEIMENVQKHLTNIRRIQEQNEMALGQELLEDDAQSMDTDNTESSQKHAKSGAAVKDSGKDGVTSRDSKHSDIGKSGSNFGNHGTNSGKVVRDKTGGKGQKDGTAEEATVIYSDGEQASEKAEFQPYDYTSAAQKMLQGKSGAKLDYFDPQSRMRKGKGPKVSKNKSYSKQGKSFTWKT